MNQQSFIYNFLLAPRFKVWRYFVLITFFIIVSLNEALVSYMKIMPIMGNNVYWIVAGTILTYIITVFLALKIIVKCLLSEKYILLVCFIIALALLYTSIANIVYGSYIIDYNFLSTSSIVDLLSAFTIYVLCISGVIIPVFLRNWMVSNQHLNQLKIKKESSYIEQFKEQINPASFFKILNRSGSLVKIEPDKASEMLMKLGQLLRYQLYDCNREQVLLTSEISFLRNFLELEKLYSSSFNYTIINEGNTNGIFIVPSVLLPYVQSVINALGNERGVTILVNNLDEKICVILKISDINNTILLQKELLKVRERINTLYKDHYQLTVLNDKATKSVEVILQLDKR